jgi:hypothetical protein
MLLLATGWSPPQRCHDHWGVIDFPSFTDFERPTDAPRERAANSSSDKVGASVINRSIDPRL